MPDQSFRTFLQNLEQQGEIVRFSKEVDPAQNMAAIEWKTYNEMGKASLFTNLKGHKHWQATSQILTDRKKWAIGLGIDENNILDEISDRLKNTIKTVNVEPEDAPVQEEVFEGDDVNIAGRGDEDIAPRCGVIHGHHFEPFHGRLKGANRVRFSDQHPAPGTAEAFGGSLADIAESGDNRNLTGHHHVRCPPNPVDQAFAATVLVVELRFRDRVVDVYRRYLERFRLFHFIEPQDAGRGLLR